jgi:hypothetical protein
MALDEEHHTVWMSYAENIWYSVDVNAAQAKLINPDQVNVCSHIPYHVQVKRKLCALNYQKCRSDRNCK